MTRDKTIRELKILFKEVKSGIVTPDTAHMEADMLVLNYLEDIGEYTIAETYQEVTGLTIT